MLGGGGVLGAGQVGALRTLLAGLDEELGLQHALASSRLYTDGAEVLYDYGETGEDQEAARAARELEVVRSDQRVFNEVVDAYLRRLEFADDGYVQLIRLPRTRWQRWWSIRTAASASRSSPGAGPSRGRLGAVPGW